MKKENQIWTLLGMTQEDIAMMLGIGRSQWSMYESDKRDLPLLAKQLLAEILTHLNTASPTSKGKPQRVERQAPPQLLDQLLHENEYQQLRLTKKIAIAHKKFDGKFKVMNVVAFLNTHSSQKGKHHKSLYESMAKKASNGITAEAIKALQVDELKLELLVLEKKLLEKKWRAAA